MEGNWLKRKWNNEQLNYAWKKLHNKRTGMYEIPILRPFEKRKLKKLINEIKNKKLIVHGYGASTKGNVLLQFYNMFQEKDFVVSNLH